MNQVCLVGTIQNEVELTYTLDRVPMLNLNLRVRKSHVNNHQRINFDIIECVLWKGLAEHVVSHCVKGDKLAVKGSLHQRQVIYDEIRRFSQYEVVVEKVTFI